MITENDIENAADCRAETISCLHGVLGGVPQCTQDEIDKETELIEGAFIKGAEWMLNQFPKKKALRVYLAALSSPGSMRVNSLDAVYAFPSIKERAKWAASVNTHYYDISFFEDEMEIDL